MKAVWSALLLSLCLSSSARAGTRTIQEGVPATANVVLVSTQTKRVLFATTTYSGAVPNTAIFTSSNVVISSDKTDHIVLYATGSIVVNGSVVGAPVVYASSVVTFGFTDITVTNTSLGPVIVTSTITTTGHDVVAGFSFSVRHGFQYYPVNACIVVDGTLWAPCTASQGIAYQLSTVAARDFLLASPPLIITGLAAGSHWFGVSVSVPAGGTATIPLNSAPFFQGYLGIREVP